MCLVRTVAIVPTSRGEMNGAFGHVTDCVRMRSNLCQLSAVFDSKAKPDNDDTYCDLRVGFRALVWDPRGHQCIWRCEVSSKICSIAHVAVTSQR